MSSNSIAGLVSGLDTTALIDAIITSRSRPLFLLQQRQAQKTAELGAWQSFEAILIGLKVDTDRLADSSLWDGLEIASSNEEVLTASAESSAALGSFAFFVQQLAQAEQRQSQAFSSKDEPVGSGTFSITSGSSTTEITVEAGSSLEDLAGLVNGSSAGVTASIVRSESAGTESFYLVLTAEETGAASSFTVDSSGLTGGTAPDLTTEPAVRIGQDAVLRFGAENGVQLHSATNTFTDVVDGLDVTVHRAQEAGDALVSVDVTRDGRGMQDALRSFVDTYNAAITFINTQYRFDPEAPDTSRPPLMGSATLTNIGADIRSLVTRQVPGREDAAFSTLFSIGIESSTNGELSFDTTAFADALEEDFEGVASLFRATASHSAAGVEWLSAPADVVLEGLSVDVVVSQAATRATLAGNTIDLSGGLTIDDGNDRFLVSVDGITSEELSIAHGTYTDGDALAKAVADAIAASGELGALGASVSFVDDGAGTGHLVFTSDRYGSQATLRLQNAASGFAAALGLSGVMSTEVAGRDVQGTIDGIAAKGAGRILSVPDDHETLGGLTFRVSLRASDVPGSITTTFAEGMGRVVSRRLGGLTLAGDGTLSRVGDAIQRRIDSIQRDIEGKTLQLERQRARLVRQYAGLESTLGRLQSQSAFLAAQLQSLRSGFGLDTRT